MCVIVRDQGIKGSLTARAMTPIITPVLTAVIKYGDPKSNSDKDGGFRPFFSCPICDKKQIDQSTQVISLDPYD